MNISSRTPEGSPNYCPICGHALWIEPSRPSGDASCPSCGSLLWFLSPAPVQPNGQLTHVSSGESIPLIRSHLTLGRRDSCNICLRYPNVSGLHCELDYEADWWIIRDNNSTNGIKVNGTLVSETVLYPGDTISIWKRDYTINYSPPSNASHDPP